MSAYISGFSVGISLIMAIGAQNVYVLKQGIQKNYVFLICIICSLSDAILITFGVSGFGIIIKDYPIVEIVARYGGAVFLLLYAVQSFWSGLKKSHSMNDEEAQNTSLIKTILVCLAFTWLNPHVYLDTVILLGSISTQYSGQQYHFAGGAVTASFVYFFSLGFGARLLVPIFRKPVSWKILDFIIAIIMLTIAISLIA